jgi:DNA-directed RNA polymerase subunit RPC12/RpoP
MNTINLDDVVVTYEGQKLPAQILINRLQEQLRDTANRLNSIAFVLNELYASMENSRIVEVKMTLSQNEYNSFKSLEGESDIERLRKAIQLMSQKTPGLSGPVSAIPITPVGPEKLSPPVSIPPVAEQEAADAISKKKSTVTRCPRCKTPLDVPDVPADQWPVEVKCGSCGAKCLIKSKSSTSRPDRNGLESTDDPAYGNLFDMLST